MSNEKIILKPYYLSVNDKIIDFRKLEFLPDMRSYENLCLFTGLYEDKSSLIAALIELGLISRENNGLYDIKIVKYDKKNDKYYPVLKSLIYRKGLRYLSPVSIKDFIENNKYNIDLMMTLFKAYLASTWKRIRIQSNYKIETREDIDTVLRECKDNPHKLRKLINEYKNINIIIYCLNEIRNNAIDGKFSMDVVPYNYDEALEEFIDSELYYFASSGKKTNFNSLVIMLNNVLKLLELFPDAVLPHETNRYSQKMGEWLASLDLYQDDDISTLISVSGFDEDDDDVEPDGYMFLEPEDFESLYDAACDELEDQVENLEQRKNRF